MAISTLQTGKIRKVTFYVAVKPKVLLGGAGGQEAFLSGGPGRAASIKLGSLRGIWKKNWHGRQSGGHQMALQGIFRRAQTGSRKIRMAQRAHTRRLPIQLASLPTWPCSLLPRSLPLTAHLLMPFPGAVTVPQTIP